MPSSHAAAITDDSSGCTDAMRFECINVRFFVDYDDDDVMMMANDDD